MIEKGEMFLFTCFKAVVLLMLINKLSTGYPLLLKTNRIM